MKGGGLILVIGVLLLCGGFYACDSCKTKVGEYITLPEFLQVAPEIQIFSPKDGETFRLGEIINFNGFGQGAAGYFWDVGEKTFNSPSFTYKYTTVGTKEVSFQARNQAGEWSDPIVIHIYIIQSGVPEAGILSPPNNSAFLANTQIDFVGYGSTPIGQVTMFAWNFGDGQTYTGPDRQVKHTYTTKGTKLIKLKVQNDQGTWSSEVQTIVVITGSAPTVGITSPVQSGVYLMNYPVSFQGFYTLQGAVVTEYEWNWGDGTTKGTEPVTSHTYRKIGTYVVTFRVKTSDGLWSDPASVTIAIVGNTIEAFITEPQDNSAFYMSDAIQFNGYGALMNGSVTEYEWNFGDGTKSAQQKTKHQYAKKGTFRVEFRVKSTDGTWSDPKVVNVVVKNGPPQAEFTYTPRFDIPANTLVIFTSTSSDPDGDALKYQWYINDKKQNASGSSMSIKLPEGVYKVELLVSDSEGAQDTFVDTVKVGTNSGEYVPVPPTSPNWAAWIFFLLLIGGVVYFWFFRGKNNKNTVTVRNYIGRLKR